MSEPSDLLFGYSQISSFLNLTVRQAKHLAATGGIPTFKIKGASGKPGRSVCARRRALTEWLGRQSGQAEDTAHAP